MPDPERIKAYLETQRKRRKWLAELAELADNGVVIGPGSIASAVKDGTHHSPASQAARSAGVMRTPITRRRF